MDFFDKKEKLVNLLKKYIQENNQENKEKLLSFINELSNDEDFKNKDLFNNIFNELSNYLSELSHKELKQRLLMIEGFID